MRNAILLSIGMLLTQPLILHAQDEFPLAWQTDHGFKATVYHYFNDDASLFLAASDEEVKMMDASGKQLWKASVKEKFGLKEISAVTWFRQPGVVRIVQPEKKKDPPVSVFLDEKTGAELWRTDKISFLGFDGVDDYQENYVADLNAVLVLHKDQKLELLNLHTGKALWQLNDFVGRKLKTLETFYPDGMNLLEAVVDDRERSYYDLSTGAPVSKITSNFYKKQGSTMSSAIVTDEDMHVRLDYKKKILANHNGLATPMTLTARRFSTGDELWKVPFEAKMVTTVATKRDMLNFFVRNDRVFVVSEGISVFDLKTGKQLWKSDFNNSEVDAGLTKVKQNINIADLPLVDGDAAYIVDLTKETYGIKKVDAATGNLIWKTQKFSSSDVIPTLRMVDGKLVAQFGGIINTQTYINTDKVQKWTSAYKFRGNPGIKVFDPATGKLLWDEQKIGEKMDFISPFVFEAGSVCFFTDKCYCAMDIASGAPKQKVSLKDLKMGEPIQLIQSDDKVRIYAVMEKGVCGIDVQKGTLLYSTPVKSVTNWFKKGDNYFLVQGEDQDKFVGVDIASGKLLGVHEGTSSQVSADGKYVVDINERGVKKYAVN